MTGAGAFNGQRLLAVFAHPDDESLASGGLLALCSRGGARIAILSLTRGEHGPGTDTIPAPQLIATRIRELEEAARLLGAADVSAGALPDGMLPWLGEGVLEGEVREAMARVAPDVVVTFDEDGLYWHPDHIAVHRAVTTAVGACADPPALYYVTMPQGQVRALAETAARRAGGAVPALFGIDSPDAFGACAPRPTLVVDVRSCAPLKLAALRCHRSQLGGALDALTGEDAESVLAVEHYRRAEVGRPGPTFVEALALPQSEGM
jgi:LmbE family N-acetylglucosaminyl deacetylase